MIQYTRKLQTVSFPKIYAYHRSENIETKLQKMVKKRIFYQYLTSIRLELYIVELPEEFIVIFFRKQFGDVDFGGGKRFPLAAFRHLLQNQRPTFVLKPVLDSVLSLLNFFAKIWLLRENWNYWGVVYKRKPKNDPL